MFREYNAFVNRKKRFIEEFSVMLVTLLLELATVALFSSERTQAVSTQVLTIVFVFCRLVSSKFDTKVTCFDLSETGRFVFQSDRYFQIWKKVLFQDAIRMILCMTFLEGAVLGMRALLGNAIGVKDYLCAGTGLCWISGGYFFLNFLIMTGGGKAYLSVFMNSVWMSVGFLFVCKTVTERPVGIGILILVLSVLAAACMMYVYVAGAGGACEKAWNIAYGVSDEKGGGRE